MPFINVMTNSEIKDKNALKSELGNAITAIPGKSEAWLMVSLRIRRICISRAVTSHALCLKLQFSARQKNQLMRI